MLTASDDVGVRGGGIFYARPISRLEAVRKGRWRSKIGVGARWGGLPQRSQRAQGSQRGIGGGMQLRRSGFMQLPWSAQNGFHQNPPPIKARITGMDLTHSPPSQVENATTPLREALRMGMGGGRSGKRLPFRTDSSFSDGLTLCHYGRPSRKKVLLPSAGRMTSQASPCWVGGLGTGDHSEPARD